jgi:hypothetical protein
VSVDFLLCFTVPRILANQDQFIDINRRRSGTAVGAFLDNWRFVDAAVLFGRPTVTLNSVDDGLVTGACPIVEARYSRSHTPARAGP